MKFNRIQRVVKSLSLALLAGCSSSHPNAITSRPPFHTDRLPIQAQTGDLIFLDLNCGELCDAIETVSKEQFKVSGPNLSHVGALEVDADGAIYVWEAMPAAGVARTPLKEVLGRVTGSEGQPQGYYIGRFKPEFRGAAIAAVQRLRTFKGFLYDEFFLTQNNRYYCSELIHDAYKKMFPFRPMYFGEPGTEVYRVWEDYYEKLEFKIPEHRAGISPLAIYLDGKRKFFK